MYDSGIQTPLIFVWKGHIKPGVKHDNGLVSTVDLLPTLLALAGANPPSDIYGKSFHELLFDPKNEEGIIYSQNVTGMIRMNIFVVFVRRNIN